MTVVNGAALLVLALKEEQLDLKEERVVTILSLMMTSVSTWWVRWWTWETSLGLLSTCLRGFPLML